MADADTVALVVADSKGQFILVLYQDLDDLLLPYPTVMPDDES